MVPEPGVTDIDSLNSDSEWKTDFAIARVGYAYRGPPHRALFHGLGRWNEAVGHVRGAPLELPHFLPWTLAPIFRIGVDLGPTIQSLEH